MRIQVVGVVIGVGTIGESGNTDCGRHSVIDQSDAGGFRVADAGNTVRCVPLVADGVDDEAFSQEGHRVWSAILDQIYIGHYVQITVGNIGWVATEPEEDYYTGWAEEEEQPSQVEYEWVIDEVPEKPEEFRPERQKKGKKRRRQRYDYEEDSDSSSWRGGRQRPR